MTRDWLTFNRNVIDEFRANNGVVAAFGPLPIVILHTCGARSGEPRLVPLIPVFDGPETYLFATNEGSPTHPSWYHNLVANPQITVEHAQNGSIVETAVVVDQLSVSEADDVLRRRAATEPRLVQYLESAAPRKVPVFRVMPSLAP